jgi:hypothetical protein
MSLLRYYICITVTDQEELLPEHLQYIGMIASIDLPGLPKDGCANRGFEISVHEEVSVTALDCFWYIDTRLRPVYRSGISRNRLGLCIFSKSIRSL